MPAFWLALLMRAPGGRCSCCQEARWWPALLLLSLSPSSADVPQAGAALPEAGPCLSEPLSVCRGHMETGEAPPPPLQRHRAPWHQDAAGI